MGIAILDQMDGQLCQCGKRHSFQSQICTGSGAIQQIPQYLRQYNTKKVFVLADHNTYAAAGAQVCQILKENAIAHVSYLLSHSPVEPDEYSVGAAFMHYEADCDLIIAVGSGVINDIGKLLACHSNNPYMIVATAPSMDGYASATSSMTRDSLKISLPSKAADVIIGDIDILKQAPMHMMKSGLGDMLAKYVSICEWRISHLITGEYYCESIAQLIRWALQRCTENAQGLLQREDAAVQAVFEGLVIGGVAMNYAGLSRPASGVEHYISHILDMRGVEFGTPVDLHGIQCAVGTLIAIRLYEKIKAIVPDREKAHRYVAQFDAEAWSEALKALLGKGADSMIELEKKEKKYDKTSHAQRLEHIIANWEGILQIIREELPSADALAQLLDCIDAPKTLDAIGTPNEMLPMIFAATKDIRDKYVLSRLAWDLGVLDELTAN